MHLQSGSNEKAYALDKDMSAANFLGPEPILAISNVAHCFLKEGRIKLIIVKQPTAANQ